MSNPNAHVWRAAQERLRRQLKRAEYDTWLRDTQLVAGRDGSTVLHVRTTFACELVKSRYHDLIVAAITEITGQPCMLSVAVMTGAEAADETVGGLPAPQPVSHIAATRSAARRTYAAYSGPTLFGMEESSADTGAEPEAGSPRAPRASQPLPHANTSERMRVH